MPILYEVMYYFGYFQSKFFWINWLYIMGYVKSPTEFSVCLDLFWKLIPDSISNVIFFMAWNAILIDTSISCHEKSVRFLSGSRESLFHPYICPLYIIGLVFCSGYQFSGLRTNYHIFWVMKVILYRLSISLLKNMLFLEVTCMRFHFDSLFIWKPFWMYQLYHINPHIFTILFNLFIYNYLSKHYFWQGYKREYFQKYCIVI